MSDMVRSAWDEESVEAERLVVAQKRLVSVAELMRQIADLRKRTLRQEARIDKLAHELHDRKSCRSKSAAAPTAGRVPDVVKNGDGFSSLRSANGMTYRMTTFWMWLLPNRKSPGSTRRALSTPIKLLETPDNSVPRYKKYDPGVM
jgi:hypothetical protein